MNQPGPSNQTPCLKFVSQKSRKPSLPLDRRYEAKYAIGITAKISARNGNPRRKARSRRKWPTPLRFRLGHTNSPDSRNINDMKNASLNRVRALKPPQRWPSTTGAVDHR